MSDWRSRATPVVSSTNDWKSRATPIQEDPSVMSTIAGKFSNGATLGFVDELAGGLEAAGQAAGVKGLGGKIKDLGFSDEGPTLDLDTLLKAYRQGRDKERISQDDMSNAHPIISGVSELAGGLATLPMGGATTLGGRVATAAGMGAVAGLGSSQADLTQGDVSGALKDTAIGGALGGALHYGGEKYIAPALKNAGSWIADKAPDAFNKAVSKVGSIATGADSDALLRNIERPNQMAAALDDSFGYNVGKDVVKETGELGDKLGQNVFTARNKFLEDQGSTDVSNAGETLTKQINEFLENHAASQKGFSGVPLKDQENLMDMVANLSGGELNGEDLVKFRDYLDHAEKLAGKYESESGPYTSFLKSLRHSADTILDKLSPEIDSANQAFAQYKGDTNLLRSATNDGQAEKMIGNLFGANKGAQQDAASRLLTSETLEKAKDIAANKAISGAQAGFGSDYGARRMIGHAGAFFGASHGNLPLAVASELAVTPRAWATGLRTLGRVEEKISYILNSNPEFLGKFAAPLREAASRGNSAVAATNFILQQTSPEYRQILLDMDKEK